MFATANSKQRRALERAVGLALKKLLPPELQIPLPIEPPLPEKRRIAQRLLAFIEQPLVLGAATVIAGLIGVALWSPVLIVCGCCFVVGLHRSRLVSDRPRRTQVFIYFVWIIFVSWSLFAVDRLITKQAKAYMAELVETMISKLPKQQPLMTIVPAPASPKVEKPVPEKPLIVITRTWSEHDSEKRRTSLHFTIENTTSAPTTMSVSFTMTLNGEPVNTAMTDMPRHPVLIAGHGSNTLNLWVDMTEDGDKAVWDGTAYLEVIVNIKYEHKHYGYIGRFNYRSGTMSILEAS